MARKRQYTMLAVQRLPSAGLLVRFRTRKLLQAGQLRHAEEELDTLVVPERLLLIDLTNVELMSSAALTLLIRLKKQLENVAGGLAMCGMRSEVEKVFRKSRLDGFFDIYRDLETALEQF